MNRKGIVKGALNPREANKLMRAGRDAISPQPVGTQRLAQRPELIFGKPNRPSTPIGGVIKNEYGQHAEQEAEHMYESQLAHKTAKRQKPEVKRTKAADLKDQYTKVKKLGVVKDEHQERVEKFKIKRFTKVESRVKPQMNR